MTSLIIRNDAQLAAAVTPQAVEMRDLALARAALIGRVATIAEQKDAVEAQKELQAYEDSMDKGADDLAEAPWKLFKAVRKVQADSKRETSPELARISSLVSDFQALEQGRQRAATNALNAELTELERQREAALAKAANHDEADAIREHYDTLIQQTSLSAVPPAVAREDGQRVATDWDLGEIDLHTLYRFHANCVKLTPRISEIKSLLNEGVQVRGVPAKRIVKATVRLDKPKAVLDIA